MNNDNQVHPCVPLTATFSMSGGQLILLGPVGSFLSRATNVPFYSGMTTECSDVVSALVRLSSIGFMPSFCRVPRSLHKCSTTTTTRSGWVSLRSFTGRRRGGPSARVSGACGRRSSRTSSPSCRASVTAPGCPCRRWVLRQSPVLLAKRARLGLHMTRRRFGTNEENCYA